MPPREETLEDLYREVGLRPAALDPRNTMRRKAVTPLPPSMRGLPGYAASNVSRMAEEDVGRGRALGMEPGRGNQVREAAGMLAETTGLPGALRANQAFSEGDTARGLGEAGMGLLNLAGTASMFAPMRNVPRAPVRAAIAEAPTPPPTLSPTWERAADGSVLPVRPQSDRLFSRTAPTSADLRGAAATPPAINAPRAQPPISPSLGDLPAPPRPGNAPDPGGVFVDRVTANDMGPINRLLRSSDERDNYFAPTGFNGRPTYNNLPQNRARLPEVMSNGAYPPSFRTLANQPFDDDTMAALARQIRPSPYDAALERQLARQRALRESRGEPVEQSSQLDDWQGAYFEHYGRYADTPEELDEFVNLLRRARGQIMEQTPRPGNAPDPGGVFAAPTEYASRSYSRLLDEAERIAKTRPLTSAAIADATGYTPPRVRQLLMMLRRGEFGPDLASRARALNFKIGPKADAKGWTTEDLANMSARGLTRAQIAERTGLSTNTISVRLHKFRHGRGSRNTHSANQAFANTAERPRGNAPDPGGVFVNASGRPRYRR